MMTGVGKHAKPLRRAQAPRVVAAGLALGALLGVGGVAYYETTSKTNVEQTVVTANAPSTTDSARPSFEVLTPRPKVEPEPNFQACPPTARACVDLTAKKSWLQKGGTIEYGPVSINSGRPGWETPTGSYNVMRHVKDEVSYEFNLEPMPWSVYFSPLGIAFHEDDVNRMSHGCIHLHAQDAQHYFRTLKVSDSVVVF